MFRGYCAEGGGWAKERRDREPRPAQCGAEGLEVLLAHPPEGLSLQEGLERR